MDPGKKLKGSEEEGSQGDKCASLSWTADLTSCKYTKYILPRSLIEPGKKLKGSEEEEQQDKCASLSWTADLCE